MTMLTENADNALAPDWDESVNIAEVDAPAVKDVDCGDHVIVKYVAAFDGVQVFVAIESVSATLPVFFT